MKLQASLSNLAFKNNDLPRWGLVSGDKRIVELFSDDWVDYELNNDEIIGTFWS